MPISPDQYEKLGSFYLGREYDLGTKQIKDDLVLYDSKDLVTHGVVLGMTGSGKTGLCLALLEEAAIDGIPVIAIDPKGDLGNALLTFPNLTAQEFRPWIKDRNAAHLKGYALTISSRAISINHEHEAAGGKEQDGPRDQATGGKAQASCRRHSGAAASRTAHHGPNVRRRAGA